MNSTPVRFEFAKSAEDLQTARRNILSCDSRLVADSLSAVSQSKPGGTYSSQLGRVRRGSYPNQHSTLVASPAVVVGFDRTLVPRAASKNPVLGFECRFGTT